mgnify:CR=1 FL=1
MIINKKSTNGFKVGDWIRVPKHNHIFQFTSTFIEEGIEYISDGYDDIFGQQGWTIDEVEPWEPHEDEWCWYGYELVQVLDSTNLNLIKICRQKSTSYEEINSSRLEPFIGKLPSFIALT